MKRIISLILTLAVALSLLVVPAGAASTPEEALGEVNIYDGGYSMKYLAVNGKVQTQSYTYFLYRNSAGETQEIPAYCVNPNQYGVPQGNLADVTIDSYQMDSDGNRISDSFGTDYPDYVTFELIPEALEDGFVPLQVFVPIMESIADGTGTQAVYLKLDWSSLKLAEADDPDFEDDGNNDNNNNTNNGNGNGGFL